MMRNITTYLIIALFSFLSGVTHERGIYAKKEAEERAKNTQINLAKYKEQYSKTHKRLTLLKEKEVIYEKIKRIPISDHECFSDDIVREINNAIKK